MASPFSHASAPGRKGGAAISARSCAAKRSTFRSVCRRFCSLTAAAVFSCIRRCVGGRASRSSAVISRKPTLFLYRYIFSDWPLGSMRSPPDCSVRVRDEGCSLPATDAPSRGFPVSVQLGSAGLRRTRVQGEDHDRAVNNVAPLGRGERASAPEEHWPNTVELRRCFHRRGLPTIHE